MIKDHAMVRRVTHRLSAIALLTLTACVSVDRQIESERTSAAGVAAIPGRYSNIPSYFSKKKIGADPARTLADYLGLWNHGYDRVSLDFSPEGNLNMHFEREAVVLESSTWQRGTDFDVTDTGAITTKRGRYCRSDLFGRACNDNQISFFIDTKGDLVVIVEKVTSTPNPGLSLTTKVMTIFPRAT
jgi:hypothetical protein